MESIQKLSNPLFCMPKENLERPTGPLFGRQFLSTLKLHYVHRRRSIFSSLCELFIPFAVILLLVGLSFVIKDEKHIGENFVNYSMMNKAVKGQETLLSFLCYDPNRSAGKIDGLDKCKDASVTMRCFGRKDGLPVEGICLDTTLSVKEIRSLVRTVFSSYGRYIMPVPSFDEMVKLQWFVKCGLALFSSLPRSSAVEYSGWLYVIPRNSDTEAMVAHLNSSTHLFKYVFSRYFDNTHEAESYLYESEDPVGNWGVITLNKMASDRANPVFDVVIRLNISSLPITSRRSNELYNGGRTDHGMKYILSGFTTLQKVLYEYFMETLQVTPPTTPLLVPMRTVDYVKKSFLLIADGLFPLVVFGFLYTVTQVTRRIVIDKELRIKEALLIMGLRQSAQYLAWFVSLFVQYFILSLVIAVLLKFTVLKNANFFVIYLLFFLFLLSLIALSGLMSTFFSKARTATMVAPFIYIAFAGPLFALANVDGTVVSVLCIFSPTALSYGMSLLFSHELSTGLGMSQLLSSHDSPDMMFVFIMLFADTVIYALLMLYFDAVMPKEWGVTRHPLFFILDYLPSKKKKDYETDEDGRNPDGVFEPLTDAERGNAAVKIRGLTKSFRRGDEKFLAVDHMHWDLIEGDISVLLGHNGAGKSTAMNMMTGMIPADSGDCFIYGHSVRKDMKGARQEIGFCPQHDVLWPHLTCYEHLDYYSSIKGLRGEAQKEAIERVLDGVDLQAKRNCESHALSGGQKRKLSLAIAFVGNSRLVFLDEPTAGMDVVARRHTWELLRKLSAGRTILMSTHFMDEADFLGNRIAIMSKGSLQCAGSGLFLKSNLGVGYNITLSVTNAADFHAIQSLIQSHVPPAETISRVVGEISFRLPMSFVKKFSGMLLDIEQSGKLYGIQSYTLSATTLEEIFLRIAHGEGIPTHPTSIAQHGATKEGNEFGGEGFVSSVNEQQQQQLGASTSEDKSNSVQMLPGNFLSLWSVELLKGETTIMCSQLKASLKKRLILAMREYGNMILQIVFPIVLIVLAMLLGTLEFSNNPSHFLSSNMYEKPVDIDLANCESAIITDIPFAKAATSIVHNDIPDAMSLSGFYGKTYFTHTKSRYTGLVCGNTASSTSRSAMFFNFSTQHAVGVNMLGYYGALVYKALSPTSVSHTEDIYLTTNRPMPSTKFEKATANAVKAFLMSILIMIPFLCVPSTYISGIVRERQVRARHLQSVSGLRFSVYWLSNYIFDFCSYLITMLLVIVVMLSFNRGEYVSGRTFFFTFILFLTYGLSSIAMAYALSFLFKEHSSAHSRLMLINLITGTFFMQAVFILQKFDVTKKAAEVLRFILRIFPSFSVSEGITNLAVADSFIELDGIMSPGSLDVTGYPIIYMVCCTVVFWLIILLVDSFLVKLCGGLFELRRKKEVIRVPTENEDDDVLSERQRVMWNAGGEPEDLVRVVDLCKVYGNGTVAVNNLTFGVRPGEVFGLLGTNGAGKTTVIAILCQEIVATSGKAAICGYDINKAAREAMQCVGYCPQFDALFGLLNVQEHLELYAGIRGVAPALRAGLVAELITLCELADYRKTYARQLSGGNKRKLSVAIALIGGPRVVFLDEPSAGLDPVARRGLWTFIQAISSSCSVVLTTHHLEEVEALAHRVAIMVKGTMRCLGNKTHLKNKYGSGFEMVLQTKEDVPVSVVEHFVSSNFPSARLNEVRGCRYTYALPKGTPLSSAFGVLESNKVQLCIEDYVISQTTIEQVFLRITEEDAARNADTA